MTSRSVLDFTGAYRDLITRGVPLGNGYRWYLPALMRFNAPDSLSPFERGGSNPYVYCHDDPVNRIDPTGHISWFPAGNDVSMLMTRAAQRDGDRAICAKRATEAATEAAPEATASRHESAPSAQGHAQRAQAAAEPHVERRMIAAKKPLLYPFYFVEGTPEIIQTREGQEVAQDGDAVMRGVEGEQWPIPYRDFNARYEYVGAVGVATPKAVPTKVIAEQMSGPFSVVLPWSGETLTLNAHDIKVTVIGEPGNVWGVARTIFFKSYNVLDG